LDDLDDGDDLESIFTNNADPANHYAMHCHTFATYDTTGNDLEAVDTELYHYVRNLQHKVQRGYVGSVPSRLCGCIEDMALVDRADCAERTPTDQAARAARAAGGTGRGKPRYEPEEGEFQACLTGRNNAAIGEKTNDAYSYWYSAAGLNQEGADVAGGICKTYTNLLGGLLAEDNDGNIGRRPGEPEDADNPSYCTCVEEECFPPPLEEPDCGHA